MTFIASVAILASLVFPANANIANHLVLTAHRYNISTVHFVAIAYAESRLNPKAVGDHGLAKNIFQFHEQTFNAFKKEAKMPYLEYNNWKDQAELAAWAFKNGKNEHWPTCDRVMKNIDYSTEGI